MSWTTRTLSRLKSGNVNETRTCRSYVIGAPRKGKQLHERQMLGREADQCPSGLRRLRRRTVSSSDRPGCSDHRLLLRSTACALDLIRGYQQWRRCHDPYQSRVQWYSSPRPSGELPIDLRPLRRRLKTTNMDGKAGGYLLAGIVIGNGPTILVIQMMEEVEGRRVIQTTPMTSAALLKGLSEARSE